MKMRTETTLASMLRAACVLAEASSDYPEYVRGLADLIMDTFYMEPPAYREVVVTTIRREMPIPMATRMIATISRSLAMLKKEAT